MPPTTAAVQRIRARIIDALTDPPPGGLSRTALIRSATGDYKAGGAVLDELIAEGVVTKNADAVLELTNPVAVQSVAQATAEVCGVDSDSVMEKINPQPKVESAASSVWDDRASDIEDDIAELTKRVAEVAERTKVVEQVMKQFSGQVAGLATVVGKLAEVVAALADVEPEAGSTPEQSSPTLFTLADVTPEGMTVLDRMSPEQRARAEEHLTRVATDLARLPDPGPVEDPAMGFWTNAQEPDYANAESFWA